MEDDGKSANDAFSFQLTVTAQFADVRWLPMMLAPLNRELTRVFTSQDLPGTPLRDRWRYVVALARIAEALGPAGLNFSPVVVKNFLELSLALAELDNGVVRHFLKPKKAGNRPHDPGDVWLDRPILQLRSMLSPATWTNARRLPRRQDK